MQFGDVGGEVERLLAVGERVALLAREADEANARIAFGVALAAGDGAGEALLAVEAEAGGQDHLPRRILSERRAEGLDAPFAAAGRPDDLFETPAAGEGLQAGE